MFPQLPTIPASLAGILEFKSSSNSQLNSSEYGENFQPELYIHTCNKVNYTISLAIST